MTERLKKQVLAALQAVATTAHACGALRHHPGDALLAAIEDHAQQHSSQYTCADWSAMLQTFTRLHARPHRLYSLLLQEVCLWRMNAMTSPDQQSVCHDADMNALCLVSCQTQLALGMVQL